MPINDWAIGSPNFAASYSNLCDTAGLNVTPAQADDDDADEEEWSLLTSLKARANSQRAPVWGIESGLYEILTPLYVCALPCVVVFLSRGSVRMLMIAAAEKRRATERLMAREVGFSERRMSIASLYFVSASLWSSWVRGAADKGVARCGRRRSGKRRRARNWEGGAVMVLGEMLCDQW
jgi:hypothetical protein